LVVNSSPATPGRTPNVFEVFAETIQATDSPDPRLCRASGYFRDVTGAPRAKLGVQFFMAQPFLLDGAAVTGEPSTLRTDANGYGAIDLVRGAVCTAALETWENHLRTIRVPDAPSCNLPDLLFPVVDHITLLVPSLRVGEEVTLTPTVLDSNGVPLPGTGLQDVLWSILDPAIASLEAGISTLVLRGLARGTTAIQAQRRDQSIVRIPATPIQGVPASVVVV
jgi:hypothetical protein